MYIGQEPATSFTGLIKQDFTVSATTSYTLSHSVNSSVDIALYRNFVRQEPETAYTCTGTNLTLSQATVSGDDLYCIYLGQALQTVNPANASVGNTQVASSIINGQTAETSIADADEVLIYDSSASALRKMTKANFVSGIGGTNTPAFEAYLNSTVNPSDATWTKVAMNTEVFDTASAYDHSSNYRFTVPSGQGGKYYVYAMLQAYATYDANAFSKIAIYKNGTAFVGTTKDSRNNNTRIVPMKVSSTMVLSASDYIEVFGYVDTTSGTPEFSATSNGGDGGYYGTRWGAYKIIE